MYGVYADGVTVMGLHQSDAEVLADRCLSLYGYVELIRPGVREWWSITGCRIERGIV